MLIENSFDLAQLDPMATNLDLIVAATKKFDVSVSAIFSPIAGAV